MENARETYKNIFEEASLRLPGIYADSAYWSISFGPPAPMTRDEAFAGVKKIKKKTKKR